jgi:hypothetical protein
VIRGSLEGVEGILIRKKNLCRLVLSVDMLAQSVGLEVAASDVEPVGPVGSNNDASTTIDAGDGNFQRNISSSAQIYDATLDSTR